MKIYPEYSIIMAVLLLMFYFIPNQVLTVEASSEDEVKFDRLTIEQGLPHGRVYSIIKDSYGYIWFGTEYGLAKFDGLRFTIYENSQENSLSISNNFARMIYEDSYGVLWIGTTQGLNRFNSATDTFTHYFNDPSDINSISDNSIQFGAICEDSQGYLWIGTDNGLNRYDRATDTFLRYFHDPGDSNSISSNTIAAIYEDSYGILWVGTAYGLNRYDGETNSFTRYLNDVANINSISDNSIWAINEDNQGVLWVGTDNGLNSFDRTTETFTRYFHELGNPNSLSSSNIRIISEDSHNILWIGTTNGLNRYDRETDTLTRYFHDQNNPNSVPNNIISQFYEDEEQGIFWIGTWSGVAKINYYKQAFKNYSYFPASGLNSNKVYFIYEDSIGLLWVGTDNGLNRISRETNTIKYYNNNPEETNSLSNDLVFSVCEDGNDILWIGTTFGLNKYDRETEVFTRYFYDLTDPNSLSCSNIRAVYRDSKGILWVGTTNGLNRYDSKTDAFTRYLNDSSNPESISDNYIITIYEDSNNILWVGTDNGLNRYNSKTDTFNYYLHDPSNPNSISANSIYNIIEDGNGVLWIGTNYGLNSFDSNENKFRHYTDGLKSPLIFGILEDDDGFIWVSTNKGLGKLNIDTGIFLHFSQQNGLTNIEYTSGACCKTRNGDLFFGGSSGIDYFNPNDIIVNEKLPPVLITGFSTGEDKVTFDRPIEEVDYIKLPYSNNSFTVEYVALDYNSHINNQYMYKLEGFDKLWHYSGYERNLASYTNIPAGKYTFIVKSSNSQGIWHETGASIEIAIGLPVWQQWWFILAITVISFLLIIILIKGITYSSNLRAQKLEALIEERTKQLSNRTEQLESTGKELEKTNKLLENQIRQREEFTRALVHELKTPLTSAINSSEALIEQSNSDITKRLSKNIYTSAIKLNKRINELLDFARTEVGILDVKCSPIDLITLVNEMSNDILLEARKKEQGLTIDMPSALPMIMADEERVEQIISNLLNNAFKYNKRNGHVLLKIMAGKNDIIIEVRDEGWGIEENNLVKIFEPYTSVVDERERRSGLGLGLALSKNLAELQNGKIWVVSKVGKGSSFFVSFPIINDSLNKG